MKIKKLRLHRETLRLLHDPDLSKVEGAAPSAVCTAVCTVLHCPGTGGGGSVGPASACCPYSTPFYCQSIDFC